MGNSPSGSEIYEGEMSPWMPGEMLVNPRSFCPMVKAAPAPAPASSDSSCSENVKRQVENCAFVVAQEDSGSSLSGVVRGPTILSPRSDTVSSQNDLTTDSSVDEIVNAEFDDARDAGSQPSSESCRESASDSDIGAAACLTSLTLEKRMGNNCVELLANSKYLSPQSPPSRSSSSSSSRSSACVVQVTPCPAKTRSSSGSSNGINSSENSGDDEEDEENDDDEDDDDCEDGEDGEDDEEEDDCEDGDGNQDDDRNGNDDDDEEDEEEEGDHENGKERKVCQVVMAPCPSKREQSAPNEDDCEDDNEEDDDEEDNDEDEDDCDDEIEIYDTDYRDEDDAVALREKKYKKQLEDDGVLVGPKEMHRIYEKYISYGGGRYSAPDKDTGSKQYWDSGSPNPCGVNPAESASNQQTQEVVYFDGNKKEKETANDSLSPVKSIGYWQDWLFSKFPSTPEPVREMEKRNSIQGKADKKLSGTAINALADQGSPSKSHKEVEYFTATDFGQKPCATCRVSEARSKKREPDPYYNPTKKSTRSKLGVRKSSPQKLPVKAEPNANQKSSSSKNDYELYKSVMDFAKIKGGDTVDNRKPNESKKRDKVSEKQPKGENHRAGEAKAIQKKSLAKELNPETESRKLIRTKPTGASNSHPQKDTEKPTLHKIGDNKVKKNEIGDSKVKKIEKRKENTEKENPTPTKVRSKSLEIFNKIKGFLDTMLLEKKKKDEQKARSQSLPTGQDKSPTESSKNGRKSEPLPTKKSGDQTGNVYVKKPTDEIGNVFIENTGDKADGVLTSRTRDKTRYGRTDKSRDGTGDMIMHKSRDAKNKITAAGLRHEPIKTLITRSKDASMKKSSPNTKVTKYKSSASRPTLLERKPLTKEEIMARRETIRMKYKNSSAQSKDSGKGEYNISKKVDHNFDKAQMSPVAKRRLKRRLKDSAKDTDMGRASFKGEKEKLGRTGSRRAANGTVPSKSPKGGKVDANTLSSKDSLESLLNNSQKLTDFIISEEASKKEEKTNAFNASSSMTINPRSSCVDPQKPSGASSTQHTIFVSSHADRLQGRTNVMSSEVSPADTEADTSPSPDSPKPGNTISPLASPKEKIKKKSFGHDSLLIAKAKPQDVSPFDQGEDQHVGQDSQTRIESNTKGVSLKQQENSHSPDKDSKTSGTLKSQNVNETQGLYKPTYKHSITHEQVRSQDAPPGENVTSPLNYYTNTKGAVNFADIYPIQKNNKSLDKQSTKTKGLHDHKASTVEEADITPDSYPITRGKNKIQDSSLTRGIDKPGYDYSTTQENFKSHVSPPQQGAERPMSPSENSIKEGKVQLPNASSSEAITKPRYKYSRPTKKFSSHDVSPPQQGAERPLTPGEESNKEENVQSQDASPPQAITKPRYKYSRPTKKFNSHDVSPPQGAERPLTPGEESNKEANVQSQDASPPQALTKPRYKYSRPTKKFSSHDVSPPQGAERPLTPGEESNKEANVQSQDASPPQALTKPRYKYSRPTKKFSSHDVSPPQGAERPLTPGEDSIKEENVQSQDASPPHAITKLRYKYSRATKKFSSHDFSLPQQGAERPMSPSENSIKEGKVQLQNASSSEAIIKPGYKYSRPTKKFSSHDVSPPQQGAERPLTPGEESNKEENVQSQDASPPQAITKPRYKYSRPTKKFSSHFSPPQQGAESPTSPGVDSIKEGNFTSQILSPPPVDKKPDKRSLTKENIQSQSSLQSQRLEELPHSSSVKQGKVNFPDVMPTQRVDFSSSRHSITQEKIKTPDVALVQRTDRATDKHSITQWKIKSSDVASVQRIEKSPDKQPLTEGKLKSGDIKPIQRIERPPDREYMTQAGRLKYHDVSQTDTGDESPEILSLTQRKVKFEDGTSSRKMDISPNKRPTTPGKIKSPHITPVQRMDIAPSKHFTTPEKVKSQITTPKEKKHISSGENSLTQNSEESPDVSQTRILDKTIENHSKTHGDKNLQVDCHTQPGKANISSNDLRPEEDMSPRQVLIHGSESSPSFFNLANHKNEMSKKGSPMKEKSHSVYLLSKENQSLKYKPSADLENDISPAIYFPNHDKHQSLASGSPQERIATPRDDSPRKHGEDRSSHEGNVMITRVQVKDRPPEERSISSPRKQGKGILQDVSFADKQKITSTGKTGKERPSEAPLADDGKVLSIRKQGKDRVSDGSLEDERKISSLRQHGREKTPTNFLKDKEKSTSPRKQGKGTMLYVSLTDEEKSITSRKQGKSTMSHASLTDIEKVISPRKQGKARWADIQYTEERKTMYSKKQAKDRQTDELLATSPKREGKEIPHSVDVSAQGKFSFPSKKRSNYSSIDDSSKSEGKISTPRNPRIKQEGSLSHSGHHKRTEAGLDSMPNLVKVRSNSLSHEQYEKTASASDRSKASSYRKRRKNISPRNKGHSITPFDNPGTKQVTKITSSDTASKRRYSRSVPSDKTNMTDIMQPTKATDATPGHRVDGESQRASESGPRTRRNNEKTHEKDDLPAKETMHHPKDGRKSNLASLKKQIIHSKSDYIHLRHSSPLGRKATKSERNLSFLKENSRKPSSHADSVSQFGKSISKKRPTSLDKNKYVPHNKTRDDKPKVAHGPVASLKSEESFKGVTDSQKAAIAKPPHDHGQGEFLNKLSSGQGKTDVKVHPPEDAEKTSQSSSLPTDGGKEDLLIDESSVLDGNFDFCKDPLTETDARKKDAGTSPFIRGVKKLKDIYFSSKKEAANSRPTDKEDESSPSLTRPDLKGFLPTNPKLDSQPQGDAEEKLLLQDFIGGTSKINVKSVKPEKIKLESIPPSHDEVVSIYTYEDSTRSQEELVFYDRVLNINEEDADADEENLDTNPDQATLDEIDSTVVLFTSSDKAESHQTTPRKEELTMKVKETPEYLAKLQERGNSKDGDKKSRISQIKEKFETGIENNMISKKDLSPLKITEDGLITLDNGVQGNKLENGETEKVKSNPKAADEEVISHVEETLECFESDTGKASDEKIAIERILSKDKAQAKIGTSAWDISFPFRCPHGRIEDSLEKCPSEAVDLENHGSTKGEQKPDSFNEYLQNKRESYFHENCMCKDVSKNSYFVDWKRDGNFSDNAVTGLLAGIPGSISKKILQMAAEKEERGESVQGIESVINGANQRTRDTADGETESLPSTDFALRSEGTSCSPSLKEKVSFCAHCPEDKASRSFPGNPDPVQNALKSYKEERCLGLHKVKGMGVVRPFPSQAGGQGNCKTICWNAQSSPDRWVRPTSHQMVAKMEAKQYDLARMRRPQSWQSKTLSHDASSVVRAFRSISHTETTKSYKVPDIMKNSDTPREEEDGKEKEEEEDGDVDVAVLPGKNKTCCSSQQNSTAPDVSETEARCACENNSNQQADSGDVNTNRSSVYGFYRLVESPENVGYNMRFRTSVEKDSCSGWVSSCCYCRCCCKRKSPDEADSERSEMSEMSGKSDKLEVSTRSVESSNETKTDTSSTDSNTGKKNSDGEGSDETEEESEEEQKPNPWSDLIDNWDWDQA